MRPAILFVFLPGMATEKRPDWPSSNKDYQIVEALAARVSRNVAIFGASAAAVWPRGRGQSWHPPWVAICNEHGENRIVPRGIVGLLVETDISFGCASQHGLEPDRLYGHLVLDDGADVEVTDPPELVKSMPPRYHVVKISMPNDVPYELCHLDNPGLADPTRVILPNIDDKWHTLIAYELDEVLPNPSYRRPDDRFEFLRPVTKGTTLYHAVATRASVVEAIAKATNAALDYGPVRHLAGLFVVDCRGRLRLLGEQNGPSQEMEALQHRLSVQCPVFGMYGDGETCTSPRAAHLHRNWTVSVLALGSDFHRRYASEARKQLPSGLDRMITELSDLNTMLKRIVQVAMVLLQTDCCHIRIVSVDGKCLEWRYGEGPWAQVVPEKIDLSDNSTDSQMLSYQAFKSGKSVKMARGDYQEKVTDFSGWRGSREEIEKLLQELEWWMSVPILEMGECLGVFSIASRDKQFLSPEQGPIIEGLAQELATTASLPIRCTLVKAALQEALLDASRANNPRELAKKIVAQGVRLLGRGAYLAMMLPDNFEKPEKLECIACTGSNAEWYKDKIFVDLRKEAGPADHGVCGWVFEKKEKWWSDNAVDEADGTGDKPTYKRCIPGVAANYVVPLLVEDDEGNKRALGVLNAEAPQGVLKREIHLDVLKTLADACATSIMQWIREQKMWNYLGRLLPGHIVEKLRAHQEKSLFETQRECKVVTVLYADIRGYTAMSEIVGEERLLAFIDDYYEMLTRAIARTQGTLDKFMGDGVVAIYGDIATLPSVYHDDEMAANARQSLKKAVDAGLEIADEFRKLADKWVQRWRRECPQIGRNPRFEIGVLLHTGKPIVGLFQPGITESKGHIAYTAIGRDMNLAARLCAEVDRNNVYVTASAWELLKSDSQFQVEKEPLVIRNLKGIPLDLEIFKVSR